MPSDQPNQPLAAGARSAAEGSGDNAFVGRPFLSVMFACCNVYQRVYRDAAGTAYVGSCPRCAKSVRFPVGPGGTSHRFFTVS